MKKQQLIIIFVSSIFSNIEAATYYIANNGNDVNNGLSMRAPFRTINKVNSIILEPGDSVLFKRGDIFRGQLNITESGTLNSPIVIAAYGRGTKPIIDGSEVITHWTKTSNNIWVANCPQCAAEVTGVYSGSVSFPLGRWPNYDTVNGGYNTILSHSGDTTLTSKEPLTTDWTGATIVARNQEWIIDKSIIKSQHGNKFTFGAMPYEARNNWGYFIQNHSATLDENGEWYYDSNDKTIGIYYKSIPPDTANTEATVYAMGINITGSFITVRDIQIEKTLYSSILGTNVSNLALQDITILNSGDNGIEINGTGRNIDLENDTINHVNNNGILVTDYTGLICKNNLLKNIGIIPGRGNSGNGQYEGLQFISNIVTPIDTSIIENNRIDSTGYIGICFQGNNIIIQKNIVSNFNLVKNDGGGIYTCKATRRYTYKNRHIISNIVYNGKDNFNGVPGTPYHGANGIYMDNWTDNVEIKNNIVFNCVGGLMLHGANNLVIIGNTFFNNGAMYSDHGALQLSPFLEANNSYNTIKDNIFFSKYPYQGIIWEWDQASDYTNFGISDSNHYCRPLDNTPIFYIRKGGTYSTISLSDWQRISGKDIHSKISPITYKAYMINSFVGPNLLTHKMWVAWSDSNNHSFMCDTSSIGAIKLSFAHNVNSTLAAMYASAQFTPPAQQGQTYILSFDAVSSHDSTPLMCQFVEDRVPFTVLSNTDGVIIRTSKKSYEVCLTTTVNDPYMKSRFCFKLLSENYSVSIDNVSLRRAKVTFANPSDSILFFYNDTEHNRKYILPVGKNYIDIKKNKYSSYVELAPFTSIILLYEP